MEPFDLDQTLLNIPIPVKNGSTKSVVIGEWTIRHAIEGVQIFGGIGSGKTSGSGRTLALKFLEAGFGGLVLTAKTDEKDTWVKYCRLAGRSQDLIILEPGGSHRFNFLQYESQHSNGEQAITDNIVQVLKTAIRAGEAKSGGKGDDAFWENALDMLIVNVIDLCLLAYGTVDVKEMYDIVQTISQRDAAKGPISAEEEEEEGTAGHEALADDTKKPAPSAFRRAHTEARVNVYRRIDEWRDSLPDEEYTNLRKDRAVYEAAMLKAVPDAQLLKLLQEFFVGTLNSLSGRTRSIIDMMFSGFLFRLLREPVYSLLCSGDSTVRPDDSLNGKIILLNLPVKQYQKVGQDCQVLFKYIWQRAMEKRKVGEVNEQSGLKQNLRPVFLWADEAQNFLHEHDADYQATARSSRIATVYLSQNMPNYYACMGGGENGKNRVNSFLGTLNTKFFHTNADIETNRYASELIGQDYADNLSDTVNMGPDFSQTVSRSSELRSHVRPEYFARLKTGGPKNEGKVECYVVWQGDISASKRNHSKAIFTQENTLPKLG